MRRAGIGLILLCGCGTPYQASGFMGGYEDYRAGNGTIMVTFQGNGYTSSTAVLRMWHRRAAEVCGGSEKYEVLDSEHSADVIQTSAGSSTTNVNVTGTGYGAYGTATTTNTGPTYVTKHQLQGLIRCVNGGSYDPRRTIPE